MRATQTILATLREDPSDAAAPSHRLMLRAGLAHKLGIGLYHLLPMGLRSFRKIEGVVREEMNRAGALEFQPPILTPAELWEKSGRWEMMSKELFRLQDRHKNWNLLGPTHEESFTELMKHFIKSHRDLPKNAYQIHTKFRDEIRPRYGMIRAREFTMKDAYSFHLSQECLEKTYQTMRSVYRRIFTRMGLDTISVEADSGSMGGSDSEEFMVPAEIGEEVLLVSEKGSYRSNAEKTPVLYPEKPITKKLNPTKNLKELEKIHTPNMKSIEAVAKALKTGKDSLLKAVLYTVDAQAVLLFLRADREVNEVKLRNHLSAKSLNPAEKKEAVLLGLEPGFIGPLELKTKELETKDQKTSLLILWDNSVRTKENWIIGSNQKDYHCKGYVWDQKNKTHDLALAQSGDPAPNGDGVLKEMKGIEVGHIFKLGRKYTQAFGMSVLDEKRNAVTPWMGCYGIGINRVMATIIEQYHDQKGICWPISAAPYEMVLVAITETQEEADTVQSFYNVLQKAGCEILWDDRSLRPGVRFHDAELIGFPIRITMGKNYFGSGKLEVQLRKDGTSFSFTGSQEELCREILNLKKRLHSEIQASLERLSL